MICPRCGYEMKEEHLYCERCGAEIQIVPDFEPEIQNSIEETLSTVAWEINPDLSENSSDLKKKPQELQYIIDHLFFSRAYSVQSSPSDKGKISGKLKMIQYFPGEYFRLRSSHHHSLSRLTQTIQQLRHPRIYLVFKPAHSRKTFSILQDRFLRLSFG